MPPPSLAGLKQPRQRKLQPVSMNHIRGSISERVKYRRPLLLVISLIKLAVMDINKHMNHKNALIVTLSLILIISSVLFIHVYHQQQRIIAEQRSIIVRLSQERGFTKIPNSGVSRTNIVAIRTDNYSGVIGKVYVEVKNGSGNVLISTNPFVEPTTQYSIREAVAVAENYTRMNISNKDIVIYFDINGSLIGGPSAGAAITAAVIAAMEGEKLRRDVAITGTIEEGGHIGAVGAVFEKATAAERGGISIFLVPEGQKNLTYYERRVKEHHIFGFTFATVCYKPREIDLGEYMADKMQVVEVSTIEEALAYMIASDSQEFKTA